MRKGIAHDLAVKAGVLLMDKPANELDSISATKVEKLATADWKKGIGGFYGIVR